MARKYRLQIYRHPLCPVNEKSGYDECSIDLGFLNINPNYARVLAEMGIIEIQQDQISASHAARLQKLIRLRAGLGINLPGAAVILDLLDRVEMLQGEIARLRRMLKDY